MIMPHIIVIHNIMDLAIFSLFLRDPCSHVVKVSLTMSIENRISRLIRYYSHIFHHSGCNPSVVNWLTESNVDLFLAYIKLAKLWIQPSTVSPSWPRSITTVLIPLMKRGTSLVAVWTGIVFRIYNASNHYVQSESANHKNKEPSSSYCKQGCTSFIKGISTVVIEREVMIGETVEGCISQLWPVLYMPETGQQLLSVSQLTTERVNTTMMKDILYIWSSGDPVFNAHGKGNFTTCEQGSSEKQT